MMIRPMRMGLLLLALGGAYWAGLRDAAQLREINEWNAQHFYDWMATARQQSERAGELSAEMEDCHGALATMNAVVVGLRAHYWPTGFDPLPTQRVRFWGVGHRAVTYDIPPPIRSGKDFDPDATYEQWVPPLRVNGIRY